MHSIIWRDWNQVTHKCVALLMGYKVFRMVISLFWEQEVVPSGKTGSPRPAFIRNAVKNEGCRAEAIGEGGPQLTWNIKASGRHAFLLKWHLKRLGGMKFFYTYILQSKNSPNRFYIGFTEHLESRLKSHNRGENPHTSKYKPWRIKTAIAFSDRQRAIDFEEYLKTSSGRAFSRKRLWFSPKDLFNS